MKDIPITKLKNDEISIIGDPIHLNKVNIKTKTITRECGTHAYMCPNCFSLIRANLTDNSDIIFECEVNNQRKNKRPMTHHNTKIFGICKTCKSEVGYIEIDPEISEAIQLLNLKGYFTTYCCQGHDKDSIRYKYSCGHKKYNYFSGKGYISFEYSDIMEHLSSLPLTWEFDLYAFKTHGKTIIRSTDFNYIQNSIDIYEWAKTLPLPKWLQNVHPNIMMYL